MRTNLCGNGWPGIGVNETRAKFCVQQDVTGGFRKRYTVRENTCSLLTFQSNYGAISLPVPLQEIANRNFFPHRVYNPTKEVRFGFL